MSRRLPLLLAAAALCVLACALAAPSAGAATHWLCEPGMANDPCTPSMTTAIVSPAGKVLRTYTPKRDAKPAYDCFYVYPTVSDEKMPQADFQATPELKSIALYQAGRYSLHCRVFAPLYRQITAQGLLNPTTVTDAMRTTALQDVEDAFKDYLAHDNRGRGFVVIGHSQGSFVLRQALHDLVDSKPAVRKRLISAVLLGGNVLVKRKSEFGGDFANIPKCGLPDSHGCVTAFSSFNVTPPADTKFGRAGAGRSLISGQTTAGTEVLCVNPANFNGGSAKLDGIEPTAAFAPGTVIGLLVPQIGVPIPKTSAAWVESRDAYSGRCSSAGGANVLRITAHGGAPVLKPVPDATWGLHFVDANIALGNLVDLVEGQARDYAAQFDKTRLRASP